MDFSDLIQSPEEVASGQYGFSLIALSGEALIAFIGLLGVLMFILFYVGLIDYIGYEMDIETKRLIPIAGPILLLALLFGASTGLTYVVAIVYGFSFGIAAVSLAGFSIGHSVISSDYLSMILGGIFLGSFAVSIILPDIAEVSLILGVLAVFLGLRSLNEINAHASHIGPVFSAVFSPPFLGIALISSLVVAPATINYWSAMQIFFIIVAFLAGCLIAREQGY